MIQMRRKQLGWTQSELARRAKVSHPTIASIEIGRRRPSPQMAERLARVLDLPAELLRC